MTTSRPVFTAHERNLAKSNWSSSTARLNRESFLPFGSCSLCLEIAREPVACQYGDLFCRECALSNLLAQKKELRRSEKLRQEAENEAVRVSIAQTEEEQARAVRDFEMTQAGMSSLPSQRRHRREPWNDRDHKEEPSRDPGTELVLAGTKRKASLDDEGLDRIARDDRAKARKSLDDEKVRFTKKQTLEIAYLPTDILYTTQAAKPTLPSFWTPSLTPQVQDGKLSQLTKKAKATPVCPASADDSPHPLSMQKLITVHFDEQEDPSIGAKRRNCPSCRKTLSNASSAIIAKRCGHVMCMKCAKQFLIPSGKQKTSEPDAFIACYVCDEPISTKAPKEEQADADLPSGLVALKSEGTGFSAKGSSTVKKSTVAFQC
jgi:nitric oxide synthase-interacting protein